MKAKNPATDCGAQLIIVEDDLVSSYAMSLMLEDHGCHVLENLVSADNIVEDVKSLQPDAILMDIRLSGEMDGTQAAIALRKKDNVPIVFISAFNDEATKSTIDAISNSMLVNKPYEIRHVVDAIYDLIRTKN